MKCLGLAAAAFALLPTASQAGEVGDLLAQHLYAGTPVAGQGELQTARDAADPEACFAWSMLGLATAYEGLALDLYRYGATTPGTPTAALLLGLGSLDSGMPPVPANPHPEPLSYEAFRTVLSDFRADLATAQAGFECGGAANTDYVVSLDLLKARIDFNGDGKVEEGETLGALLAPLVGDFGTDPAMIDKSKSKGVAPDTSIGFDAADSIWLAGYSQVIGVQLDLLLAHDFSEFFNAYMHRAFPLAGLPMQDFTRGGTLVIDPESDAGIADVVAAIHSLNFPVVDRALLQSIPAKLHHITALSRQNWDLLLAETDDNRELVPNPNQTSLIPDMAVTDASVAAWRETLDVLDQIIDGKLLIPHWRFTQGFDLAAYFAEAERTDLVLLMTGQAAVPYLRDGPVADADSFAAANRVFGDRIIDYGFWFN
ncbi:MAG: hypothetical protein KKF33_01890 [Alphaproteobacteria bacterium]|nr:hypothetical protein [Alphaproteobacteria bacterium]